MSKICQGNDEKCNGSKGTVWGVCACVHVCVSACVHKLITVQSLPKMFS